MNESVWVLLLIVFLCVQVGIWLLIFNKLAPKSTPITQAFFAPVSIVICARNAKYYLEQNLEAFLTQSYPEFELILVDDGSDDGTEQWVENLLPKYPQLKYFKNYKTAAGKKQALILGISKASNFWIALTDADCRPSSPFWLKTMMSNEGENTKIVLAYSPYEQQAGWLNKLIRMEGMLNLIQYFSAATMGFPYMGTGRNLVYHKSIFDTEALRLDLAYGDDDLLISTKATKENTVICMDPDSFIYTNPPANYTNYFKQKWRHYSAAHEYKFAIKGYLFIYFASLVGFYLSFVVLILFKQFAIAIISYLFLLLVTWPVFCKKSRLLNAHDLCNYYPVLSWMYVFHIIIQLPLLWIKKKKW